MNRRICLCLHFFVSPSRNGCSVGSGKSHIRDSISAKKRVGSEGREKLYYSQLYGCHGGGGKMFDVGHLIFFFGGGVNKNLSAAFSQLESCQCVMFS